MQVARQETDRQVGRQLQHWNAIPVRHFFPFSNGSFSSSHHTIWTSISSFLPGVPAGPGKAKGVGGGESQKPRSAFA